MKNALIFILLFIFSLIAIAKEVGNGGIAWGCFNNDASRSLRWIRLVDLYEVDSDQSMKVRDFSGMSLLVFVLLRLHYIKEPVD